MKQRIEHVRDVSDHNGTFGTWVMPSGKVYQICEPPWNDNKQDISCIPDGLYQLHLRDSNLITRITHGRFTKTWEFLNVPDRQFVELHPGNTIDDTDGCNLPGTSRGTLGGKPAVLNSQAAYARIMKEMDDGNEWEVNVTWNLKEYP